MSRITSLKDFQENLARRLREAGGAAEAPAGRLAVEAGGSGWLLRLEDTAEVLPVPSIMPLPLVRPWFLGLANVRGNLIAVTDLARFAGGASAPATPRGAEARVVMFAGRFGAHCGLLVSRVAGLRAADAFRPADAATTPSRAWLGARLLDAEGREWRELLVPELIASDEFLHVAAERAA